MTRLDRPVEREIPVFQRKRVGAGIRGTDTVFVHVETYAIKIIPPPAGGSAIIKIGRKRKRRFDWYETTIDAIFWMAVKKEADRLVAEREAKREERRR